MTSNHKPNAQGSLLVSPADLHSEEVKEALNILEANITQLAPEQQQRRDLYALQLQLEDYLLAPATVDTLKTVGDFLQLYLNTLHIDPQSLATYINLSIEELNQLLEGDHITVRLSLILGKIFQVNPEYWMQVQTKNQCLTFKRSASAPLDKEYKLSDLL